MSTYNIILIHFQFGMMPALGSSTYKQQVFSKNGFHHHQQQPQTGTIDDIFEFSADDNSLELNLTQLETTSFSKVEGGAIIDTKARGGIIQGQHFGQKSNLGGRVNRLEARSNVGYSDTNSYGSNTL